MFFFDAKEYNGVLLVFAHPDDAELLCGGTMLKLSQYGYTIKIICVANETGDTGQKRQREAYKSAKLIGAEIEFLSFKDGYLTDNKSLHAAIGLTIDTFRPQIIFTHNFHKIPDHQDHIAVGKVVSIQSRKFSSVKCVLLGAINTSACIEVDISNHHSRKTDLLSVFESQREKWYMDITNLHHKIHDGRYIESFAVDYIST